MAKKKFKIIFDIETSGDIGIPNIKQALKEKFDDFTLYNDEDEEVEINLPNFWERVKVLKETQEPLDLMAESNKLLRDA